MKRHFVFSKTFFPLFLTQFFGAFNDNAFKSAILVWFTYDVGSYHGISSGLMVTLAAALFIFPFFLFSSFAGNLSDKFEKTTCTRWIKTAEVLLMLMGGFFFYQKSIEGLLLILFMMGVQSAFFGPIKYSLIPMLLKKSQLLEANALIEMGTFLAIIAGTIFGALMINKPMGILSLSVILLISAMLGLLCSFWIPSTNHQDPHLKLSFQILRQTWHVLSIARDEKQAWHAIRHISWFWVIGMCFLTQIPVYTEHIIGGNENLVTLFLCLFCLGISIGSFASKHMIRTHTHPKSFASPLIWIGVSIIALVAFSSRFTSASLPDDTLLGIFGFLTLGINSFGIVLSFVALSFFSGLYVVPQYTRLQSAAKTSELSRTIAANNIMNSLWMVLCSLVIMVIYQSKFNVIHVFLLLGISTFAFYAFSTRFKSTSTQS